MAWGMRVQRVYSATLHDAVCEGGHVATDFGETEAQRESDGNGISLLRKWAPCLWLVLSQGAKACLCSLAGFEMEIREGRPGFKGYTQPRASSRGLVGSQHTGRGLDFPFPAPP